MEIASLFYLFINYIVELWITLDSSLTFTFQGLRVHVLSFFLVCILIFAFIKFIWRLF